MRPLHTTAYFLIGFFLGTFIVLLLPTNKSKQEQCSPTNSPKLKQENPSYDKWFKTTGLRRRNVSLDILRYSGKTYLLESEYLKQNIKVFCIVLVKNDKNTEAANETWVTGCNDVQYVNVTFENKKMPVKRTKERSNWVSLCKLFTSISMDFQWYLIVYDSTYVIMENLRLLVAGLDSTDGHYLGHAVRFWSTIYNSGQAGYVLSVGSLMKLRETFKNMESCISSTTYLNQEDFYLGI